MDDLLYRIAVTFLPKVGAVTARTLISYCGSPRAVFETPKRELLRIPGIGPRIAASVSDKTALQAAEAELRFLEQSDVQPLFYLDPGYPQRLRHLHDAPVMLYYRGNADLNAERTLAVVGTRKPSRYGVATCEELVEQAAHYGVVLISGLAYGIDAAAHRQCLQTRVPTIGVLGHGLASLYPSAHRELAEKMSRQGGLLSEYPSQTGPDREHFPMRNRIIAGLCDALIVVETGRKGGSIISALFANDYNKDVFAVPGRLRDPRSEGCNHLIKTHKAHLLENMDDLAYIMRWDEPSPTKNVQPQLFVELTEAEKLIVALLNQTEEVNIDKLTYDSKMSNSEMATLLLNLEFKGVIKSLPGKRYALA